MAFNVYRRPQGAATDEDDAWRRIAEGVLPPYTDTTAVEGQAYEYAMAEVASEGEAGHVTAVAREGVEGEKGHVTAGSLWLPTRLEGLRLWLRADEGVYQDTAAGTPADSVGDPVALWQDQSDGQSYDLSQSDSAARPVLQRRGDGSPYVDLDGSSQYLQQASSIVSGSQNRTIFIRGRGKDSVGRRLVSQGHGDYDGGAFLVTNESGVRVYSGYRLWTDDPFTSRSVLSVILTGDQTTDLSAYLDGALLSPTNTNPQSIDTASEFFWLGANAGGSSGTIDDFTPGEIESVLLYDRALSHPERRLVERYLAPQYGDNVAPATPAGFTADGRDGAVVLSWDANSEDDLMGYYLHRDGTQIQDLGRDETDYTDNEVSNGTTYNYDLSAYDTDGNESPQASASASPSASTSTGPPYTFDDQTLQGMEDRTGPDADYSFSQDTPSGSGYALETYTGDGLGVVAAAVVGGQQLTSVTFYYREDEQSNGGGIRLTDSAGDTIVGFATDNPEWRLNTASNDQYVGNPGTYDQWMKVEATLDWSDGTCTATFKNLASGESASANISFETSAAVDEVQWCNYSSGAWYPEASGNALRMLIDELDFSSS